MRTRNSTPFLFGVTSTSRRPPAPEATFVVRGRFRLAPGAEVAPLDDQGRLTGDVFAEDDDDRAGASLYPSDFAAWKPRVDVLVRGSFHAPDGVPVTDSFVDIRVGALAITRRVVGPRVWTESVVGPAFTEPLPFTSMPLDWAHAFGGAGFADNPVGKGLGTHELPNVELASEPLLSKGDRPRPAGLGPVSPTWPERAKKLGSSWGRAWKKERAPFVAEDFDWSHHNAAPDTQQLGELRGDELVVLRHVSPRAASFEARLPGLRVRVFVRDTAGRFREVTLALDTLLLDLDDEALVLTWRGVDQVAELDRSDLAFALVASELLADEPRPLDEYARRMDAFVLDPLGVGDHVSASQLARLRGERSARPVDPALDPLSAALDQRLGDVAPEHVKTALEAIQKALELAREPFARASEEARKQGKDAPLTLDDALAKSVRDGEATRAPIRFDGKPPRVELRAAINRAREGLATFDGLEVEQKRRLPEIDASLRDPRLLALDPGLGGDGPPLEPGPNRDLRGADFAGRDLANVDLSGSNLEGANLARAKLTSAKLDGAKLGRANLEGADLDGASLVGAELELAHFGGATLRGANLAGAKLTRALFLEADLSNAILDDASGVQALFGKSKLAGARARRLSLSMSDLSGTDLSGADLSEASLFSVLASGSNAVRARFERAQLTKTSFAGANLTEASFVRARGKGPSFQHARLDRADFSFSILPGAHFSEAQGVETRFYAANLRDARFYRAWLERATFAHANLFAAELGLASVPGTSFAKACLFDAKLVGTNGKGCDFLGANLKRSTLEDA